MATTPTALPEAEVPKKGAIPAIRTIGLTKLYGTRVGISDLDLEVAAGEVFGYLGPNGSGKTTTMRILMDLIRPTSGRAMILGLDVRRNSTDVHRSVGFVPGDLALYPNLNGVQLLTYLSNLRGMNGLPRARELAERLHVDLSRVTRELSTGDRQKLGLIQAWMHDPKVLILDEPTTGLDPLAQQQVHDMIVESRDAGRTVFLSSHLLSQVDRVADRVGILREGRLIAVEDMAGLKEKATRFIEAHFESPVQAERFAGVPGVSEVRPNGTVLRLRVEGSMGPALRAIAELDVINLISHEPDLEDVFLGYYGRGPDVPQRLP